MGVVSNKINIMELMKSGGGGDPTIPGRVSALENEMTGVYASINQISTVELPKVYSSISAVSNLILEPVTGLEDRVEVLENGTEIHLLTVTSDGIKTYGDLLLELKNGIKSVYDSLADGKTLEIYTLYDALEGGTKYGTFMGLRNPFTKGTDTFSGSLRFCDIISNSGIGGFAMTITSYYVSGTPVLVTAYLKDDNTVTMTNVDLTQVPANGRTAYIRYRVF